MTVARIKPRNLPFFMMLGLGFAFSGACTSNGASERTDEPAPVASSPPAEAPTGGAVPDGNMPRASVPDQYKWNLGPLFEGDEAFSKGLALAAAQRQRMAAYQGKLDQPVPLYECLKLYFDTRLITNKATLYGSMRLDTDEKSTTCKEMNDRALDAMNELIKIASVIRQEVLAMDDAAIDKAYLTEPRLVEYRPYLSELRRRRSRVLDPAAERVMALAGDNLWAEIDLNELPSDHEKSFKALLSDIKWPKVKDEKGQEVQLTLANYSKYRGSSDRGVRKQTVESFFATLRQHEHAFASSLSGQVRVNVFLARARGYDTALEAYVDKDNISPAVYDNLLQSIHSNLAPMHRYIKLRKRLMGLDELRLYDLYVPMVKAVRIQFPYDQALKILPEALAPLGPDYLKVLREGMDTSNGWLDLYPHKDKQSGAFSSSVYGVHPYVKMNYFNEHNDLSTLAHEYGHAVHSHFSMANQPYVTAGYTAFTAEIASTFNEKLLSDYLVQKASSDDEKLYLLNQLVETIRTTIYRQALFAEFEKEAHTAAEKGTPLTSKMLNDTYGRLVRQYYGDAFTVGTDDAVEWAYIPHFYYKYYVYAYATGLSAGIALAERVQQGGPEARDAYLTMLKSGSSKPPLELLRAAGVDLTQPHAIESAARLLDSTLAQMEEIVDRRK